VLSDVPGLSTKRLELIKEAVPSATRVGHLWDLGEFGPYRPFVEQITQTAGVELRPLPVSGPDDFRGAFKDAVGWGAEVLFSVASPMFQLYARQIATLALQHGLPSMFPLRPYVDAGGIMAYGVNPVSLWRRSAVFVDNILKSAKPADLPFEQPMTFDFVINLRTAQALGLTIPQHVLLQATEIIG
jgi:putative ABC transport system substrate-binding protein